MRKFFPPFLNGAPAVGLLLVRLFMGVAFVLHSQSKIHNPLGWMGPHSFPPVLQGLATLAEFGGGLALIFGLLTPLAALGIFCTMSVACLSTIQRGAGFLVGKGPSWEVPALYLTLALMFLLTGPGVLSLDALLLDRERREDAE
jgi:putative oxidoreductase